MITLSYLQIWLLQWLAILCFNFGGMLNQYIYERKHSKDTFDFEDEYRYDHWEG